MNQCVVVILMPLKGSLHVCSDGVIAYYWIRFSVPPESMELLIKVTEDRVLETLRRGVRQEGKRSIQSFTITDITASSNTHTHTPTCLPLSNKQSLNISQSFYYNSHFSHNSVYSPIHTFYF